MPHYFMDGSFVRGLPPELQTENEMQSDGIAKQTTPAAGRKPKL